MNSPKARFGDPIVFYVAFLAAFLIFNILYSYSTYYSRDITIKQKNTYSSGRYVRNTFTDENGNVYEATNSLPYLHFTAAEIWSRIEVNKKYSVTGYGLRIAFLGFYPNIISIKDISAK